MKKIGAMLVILGFALQAHAIQEVKLTDPPPLQPVHWCKHADGSTTYQNEACGADTTEVSGISQRQPDGHAEFQPLDKKDAAPAANPASADGAAAQASASASDKPSPEESKKLMKDARTRFIKWIGFALVIAVIAKLLKRSFFLWLILGFILRMVLVAANVMAF